MTNQMRSIIKNCGKSQYEISKETDIAQATLSRFMRKKRSLSTNAWDALGKYFFLELRESHLALTNQEKLQEVLQESGKRLMKQATSKKRSKKRT
ncbi:MAG: helix-turn-helix domain-containing protein [Thermoguttaceae bacterium]